MTESNGRPESESMSTKSEVVPTARFLSYVAQQYKVNTSFYSSAYQAPDLP